MYFVSVRLYIIATDKCYSQQSRAAVADTAIAVIFVIVRKLVLARALLDMQINANECTSRFSPYMNMPKTDFHPLLNWNLKICACQSHRKPINLQYLTVMVHGAVVMLTTYHILYGNAFPSFILFFNGFCIHIIYLPIRLRYGLFLFWPLLQA